MYTIDLFSGSKQPLPSRPISIAAATVCVLIPVIIASYLVSVFFYDRISLTTIELGYQQNEAVLKTLHETDIFLETVKKSQSAVLPSLQEVSLVLPSHTPLSPLAAALTEKMPPSLMLKRIAVERISEPVAPGKTAVFEFKMHLGILAFDLKDIQLYMQLIRSDAVLSQRFKNIRMATQQQMTVQEKDYVFCALEMDMVMNNPGRQP